MKQEVYFKNIQSKIVELLERAEFDIKIAVAWFTDEKIIRVLNKKKKNGVNIEVVIYNDKINKADLYFELVKSEVNFYKSSKLMHNKFCVIDEEIVINGSYNWTNNATSNNENITVLYSFDLVTNFLEEFNKITTSKFISKLKLSDYSKSNSYEFQADEIISKYQFPFFFKRNDEIKFIRNKNDILYFFDRVK
ncbi:phospholipase D-like domain-containing protein, partial [Flavobacterium sp.]|uniref:phospholipase D-like domain-containing protein n=1 Tax=Flavobacterium sp. TaxID=239 RepID=UPI0025C0A60A